MATLEKPKGILQSKGEVVCYLMNWGDRYTVEAAWKSKDTIFISSPDRLEQFDFQDSKESCAGITVKYNVQFRSERQTTDDHEVIAKIRKALSEVAPCISSFYGRFNAANETDGPVARMNELIHRGEHRSTVELLCGYISDASCSISPATYQSLKELSETFDLKPAYLESVSPLVKP